MAISRWLCYGDGCCGWQQRRMQRGLVSCILPSTYVILRVVEAGCQQRALSYTDCSTPNLLYVYAYIQGPAPHNPPVCTTVSYTCISIVTLITAEAMSCTPADHTLHIGPDDYQTFRQAGNLKFRSPETKVCRMETKFRRPK